MALTGTIRLDGVASWSRHASAARFMLRCHPVSNQASLLDPEGAVVRQWRDPLEALHWMSADAREFEWIGYISYDAGRWFESLPNSTTDNLNLPFFIFTAHESGPPAAGMAWQLIPPYRDEVDSTFRRDEYEAAVRECLEYIRAGDVFQINLSQRFSAPLKRTPSQIYEQLCLQTPAHYGALLEYEDFALICNSPELFLRVTPDRRIITRPIKGTRPKLPGMEEQLLRSAKDQAELNMIVDLERNDLGRVCEIGSVRVTEPRVIEMHPTVHHGVATIEGTLREGVTFVDLLQATFPGGSITGAPKIRAMEIIEAMERLRRGAYCGAIGHLSPDGTIELNIAIRTMTAKGSYLYIPVGGGIVADSDPAAEYEETLVKAQAMFAAAGIRPEF